MKLRFLIAQTVRGPWAAGGSKLSLIKTHVFFKLNSLPPENIVKLSQKKTVYLFN